MKRVLSILLSILMLVAVLHLSVATHYCGGKEIAMKVSFTAKLADCGMESKEKELPLLPGASLTNHCCNDVLIICGTDNNWTPSFSFIPQYYPYVFQFFAIPSDLTVNTYTNLILSYTNVSPPGVLMSTNVDLSGICVFRI